MIHLRATTENPFAQRVLLIGKTGSGKSAKMLELLNQQPRVVGFDTMGRYFRPNEEDDFIQDQVERWDFIGAGLNLEDWLRARLFVSEFRCWITAPYEPENALEKISRLVTGWANATGKQIVLAVDEARLVCSPSWILREFARVVNFGRGDGVWLFANTQRPAQIHNDLRAACNHWLIFKTENINDLDALAAQGLPVYEQRVAELPPRAFLYYRDDGFFCKDTTAVSAVAEP